MGEGEPGGEETELDCDTGSNTTINEAERYREAMGKEVAVRSYLRAWGMTDYLDTEGMFTKRIVNG